MWVALQRKGKRGLWEGSKEIVWIFLDYFLFAGSKGRPYRTSLGISLSCLSFFLCGFTLLFSIASSPPCCHLSHTAPTSFLQDGKCFALPSFTPPFPSLSIFSYILSCSSIKISPTPTTHTIKHSTKQLLIPLMLPFFFLLTPYSLLFCSNVHKALLRLSLRSFSFYPKF
jgi:hypothetical protein